MATQDPVLRARLDPDEAAERVYNFLHCLTIEAQMMARACGKTNIQSLEPDLHGRPMQELYHLTDDPGEQRNCAEELPEIVEEFADRMDAHVSKRLAATGRAGDDPILRQPIPMRQIGSPKEAHPKDEKRFKDHAK